jgi:hypothetical protein
MSVMQFNDIADFFFVFDNVVSMLINISFNRILNPVWSTYII